jgi:hypothetical protein
MWLGIWWLGRLQVAEEELPNCTDMIFTMRQLVEKSWEHTAKPFSLSLTSGRRVPRYVKWVVLRKLGACAKR